MSEFKKKPEIIVFAGPNGSDICHIYDNSEDCPFRIFKKRKTEFFYNECQDWLEEDIRLLTGIQSMQYKNLNSESVNY